MKKVFFCITIDVGVTKLLESVDAVQAMTEHTFPFDKNIKLPHSDLDRFCQYDRQAFSLYVSFVLIGKIPANPVSMSEKTARDAKKRMLVYLSVNTLAHSSKESIFQYLDQLHRVDIRLLPVYFHVARLYGQSWRAGKPLDSIKVNHRELAAVASMDYKGVPDLLTKLSGQDLVIVAEMIGTNETLVRMNTAEDASLHEGIRDVAMQYMNMERQDREERRRLLPSRFGNPDEHLFLIPFEQRPPSNEEIHDDVLKLISMFKTFASKPGRKVANFPVSPEYKTKGIIKASGGALRAVEDWIVANPDWYEKWTQVLDIAESNLYLKGLHHGTHTPHIEGDEDEFIVKDVRHRYGKPTMNLAWFFTVNTGADPLKKGFHLDMVLAEHYEVFTETGMQHLFDVLTPTERCERLEHIVGSFNALKKNVNQIKRFKLIEEYFTDSKVIAGDQILNDILEWTCLQEDWRKEWLERLSRVAKSKKKEINLISVFNEIKHRPKLNKTKKQMTKTATVAPPVDVRKDWTIVPENQPEQELKAGYHPIK